jgi:hypothetical protein
MRPVTPVFPGLPNLPEVTFAKDQPQYIPLPALLQSDGLVTTRWSLTWRERIQVLFGGNLWLQVLTFNRPFQPVSLSTECPISRADAVIQEELRRQEERQGSNAYDEL